MCMSDHIRVQLGSLRVFVYICVYIHGCICITHRNPQGFGLCLHIYKRKFVLYTNLHLQKIEIVLNTAA